MEIPADKLSPETLRSVIEEFVSREGTEYGERDYTLDEKVAQVRRLLDRGEAKIVYDEGTESCSIVSRR